MKRAFLILLILGFAQAAHAKESVEPINVASNEQALMLFTRILRPTPENDIFVDSIVADKLEANTHLRIWYQSSVPVPIEYGFLHSVPNDMLAAVLPPAQEGDVLVPLLTSPSFSLREKGVLLKVYGLQKEPPAILNLTTEDHGSFLTTITSAFSHLFFPEKFTYSSMSELAGYRVNARPLTLLIAALFLLLLVGGEIILFVRTRTIPSRFLLFRHASILLLAFLFLYEVRFLFDLLPAQIALQREWSREEHFGHMGDVYAIAEEVRKVATENDGVLLCDSPVSTPLTYLLFPIPVYQPESLKEGDAPVAAITVKTWDEKQRSFACGPYRFSGAVLRLFPDSEALVRFTPPS